MIRFLTLLVGTFLLWISPLNSAISFINLDEIIWMWDLTTIADKRIIEDNQKGVLSKKYTPGPLSQMEKGLDKFKNWYLKQLKIALE